MAARGAVADRAAAFVRGTQRWLAYAIAFHFLFDLAAVLLTRYWHVDTVLVEAPVRVQCRASVAGAALEPPDDGRRRGKHGACCLIGLASSGNQAGAADIAGR